MKLYRPFPIEEEIKIKPKRMLVTKTDMQGNILEINPHFEQVVGYRLEEIYGTPHEMLRHPDMPEVILFLITKAMERGEMIRVIVKNLTKSGAYYWAITDFEPDTTTTQKVESFFAFRQPIPSSELDELIELYATLRKIEKSRGVGAALLYLNRYLYDQGMNFEEFMNQMSLPKSFIRQLFVSSFAPDYEQKAYYKSAA